jgi:hypothetical protein
VKAWRGEKRMTKNEIRAKIWESEGMEYYFTDYDPDCSVLEEVLDPESLRQIRETVDAFNNAKEDLVFALEDVGLGPPLEMDEEEA